MLRVDDSCEKTESFGTNCRGTGMSLIPLLHLIFMFLLSLEMLSYNHIFLICKLVFLHVEMLDLINWN